MKDYYRILGIKYPSTDMEIKNSYRILAFKYHPDTNHGDKASEEIFKEINEAYSLLSNTKFKEEYDKTYCEKDETVVSATKLLGQLSKIRQLVFNKDKRTINKENLFNALDYNLDSNNIKFLLEVGETEINREIIYEVLKCCYYLKMSHIEEMIGRLIILSAGDSGLLAMLNLFLSKRKREKKKKIILYVMIGILIFVVSQTAEIRKIFFFQNSTTTPKNKINPPPILDLISIK